MAQEFLASSVANTLGARIVNGELGLGDSMRLDDIENEFGVSRSVSREAVKIMESLNLVRSRRRVGVLILPPTEWDVMAPRVITWQLAGPNRINEMTWISQLRSAIEPMSARLAASHATTEQCQALSGAVTGMSTSAVDADLDTYLEHDIVFHTTLLRASGNPLFAAQTKVVTAVLEGRTHLMPFDPKAEAIALHRTVADSIAVRDPDRAEEAMRAIVDEAQEAMEDSATRDRTVDDD